MHGRLAVCGDTTADTPETCAMGDEDCAGAVDEAGAVEATPSEYVCETP